MGAVKIKQAPRRKAISSTRQRRTQAAGSRDEQFWKAHPGIVWSNPQANDTVMIANALVRGNASTLVDIAKHFGLARVRAQWRKLKIEAERFPADLRAVHSYGPQIEAVLRGLRKHA